MQSSSQIFAINTPTQAGCPPFQSTEGKDHQMKCICKCVVITTGACDVTTDLPVSQMQTGSVSTFRERARLHPNTTCVHFPRRKTLQKHNSFPAARRRGYSAVPGKPGGPAAGAVSRFSTAAVSGSTAEWRRASQVSN